MFLVHLRAGAADRPAGGGLRVAPHPQRPRPAEPARGAGGLRAVRHRAWSCSRAASCSPASRRLIEVKDPTVRGGRLLGARRHPARWSSGCSSCTAWPASASAGGSGCAGRPWPAVFAAVMLIVQSQDPRQWNVAGPASGEQYFFPSLARTATGNFIPARVLMNDQLLQGVPRRHPRGLGAQRPPLQLVQQPGLPVLGARDAPGRPRARRQRAGLALLRRLPRPGAVLQRQVRRPELRRRQRPHRAGRHHLHRLPRDHPHQQRRAATPTTPSRSRSTTRSPSARTRILRWVNRQLVKAKPEFHKKTFLKPLHKTAEFCGTCHKVHLPAELNHYKWLRGQDHYDAFLLQRRLRARRDRASTTRRRPSRTATAATCR